MFGKEKDGIKIEQKNLTTIISLTGISGVVGGMIGAYFKMLLDKKKEISLSLNRINEERYRLDIRYKLKRILQHGIIYACRLSVDESEGLF